MRKNELRVLIKLYCF